MVGGVLVKAHGGFQLRNDLGDDGGVFHQLLPGDLGQEAAKLPIDPFPGQMVQKLRQCQHGPFRLWLRGEIIGHGEPHPPQNPQGVLPEAGLRVSHAAKDPLLQVLFSAKRVLKPPLGGPGHGVHRKIPAGQILADVRYKFHPVRVPVVGIGPFLSEGGALHYPFLRHHSYGAVLFARQHQILVMEKGFHFLRGGGGAEVKVVGLLSQKPVPDAAAHAVGFKSRLLQGLQASGHGSGDQHDASCR